MPPAVHLMRKLGLAPDPWQTEVLTSTHPRLLLNCCRQAGKSTTVALLGLSEALFEPGTQVLLLSRSLRQSAELFHTLAGFYRRLGSPLRLRHTVSELHLTNMSRIVCLPCKEETIRGYANVALLIIDEAARVPDDLYRAVSPMLAVSGGRMICLSTPYGCQGFFHDAWARGGPDWHRVEIPAAMVPRIKADFLERERRTLGESWFRQEYCCSFESVEGLVFPDFARCVVPGPAPEGKKVGGIDFGVRNPFAALWGVVDRDDVLWLTGEHYVVGQSLAYHASHLPKGVIWHADPEGAREILELRVADVEIQKADNSVRAGIAAVRARLEDNALHVVAGSCPNLLAEMSLYRYDSEGRGHSESPLKEHDHAADALRYLVASIDRHRMARFRKGKTQLLSAPASTGPPAPRLPRPWLRLDNEFLWHPL